LLQRDDTEVLDEPLYANFLRVTGVERPYREELLSKMVRLCVSDCLHCCNLRDFPAALNYTSVRADEVVGDDRLVFI
jgi:hypothetical protein